MSAHQYTCLEKASKIAEAYGFTRLPEIAITKTDIAEAKALGTEVGIYELFNHLHRVEQVALINAYTRKELQELPQPVMSFYESRFHRDDETNHAERTITFDVISPANALIEAALIHLGQIILAEEISDELIVELNSVGDKESVTKFNRELAQYYKKRSADIPAAGKILLKKDPLALYLSDDPAFEELNAHAPQPLSFLSDQSSAYFKQVLDAIEKLDICYRINPKLIPDRNSGNETVFSIHSINETKLDTPAATTGFAIGTRYNVLTKKIGAKKDIPAIRMVISLPKMKLEKIKPTTKKTKKTPFYFVQIGNEAKLKGLQVIEMLRKAKIGIQYGLVKDKLVGQLTTAEQLNAPYILLMGQRECMEKTVLVRDMSNRSQETVPMNELVTYLKELA